MDLDREYPAAAAAGRALARAEHLLWQTVIDEHAAGTAAVDATDDTPLGHQVGHRAVTLDLAQTLHISEMNLWSIHTTALDVARRLPALWAAFAAGDVDGYRVRTIARFLDQATTPRFLDLLDTRAVSYASTHTAAELRTWLRRWHARLEAEQVAAETARALEHRRVEIRHNANGTSWIEALLPTPVALAVAHRLRQAVKKLPRHDPDPDPEDSDREGIVHQDGGSGGEPGTGDPHTQDTRTLDVRTTDQKQVDLLAHWLTSCEDTQTDVRAEIAISIDAIDLYGLTDGPGTTRDGRHPVPAAWVREMAASETTLFRRLVLDPTGQVLDTTSLGYQPSNSLRAALRWRDGTCRVAGCQAPILDTDLDHRTAHGRGGSTDARNLQSLCRRHHTIKSHGHLDRRHLRPPPTYREHLHPGPPVVIELVHQRPRPPDPPTPLTTAA